MLLLSRVVTRLGELGDMTPETIEGLYAADFDHLQRLYERLNTDGEVVGRSRARVLACLRGGL